MILIVSFYQLQQLYYELGQLLLFQIGTKDIASQGRPHFYISGQNYYKSRQLWKIWADLLQMWDAITDRDDCYSFDLSYCCDITITLSSTEAVVQSCSVEKLFLEISQNLRENTCASLFFNKVAGGLQLY